MSIDNDKYKAILDTVRTEPGYYMSDHTAERSKAASNKLVVAERRAKVAALSHARVPQYKIAEILQVSPGTVSGDVKWLKDRWLEEALEDTAAQRERELTELSVWEAKLANEAAMSTGATAAKIVAQILNIKDARARLLGLYAPTKVAPTNPDGTAPYASMTEDDLNRAIQDLITKTGVVR